MTVEGVDYAFGPIPSAGALVAAGKRFAARYGGPGSAGKQLTADELANLTAAGIYVVANAEGAADGLKGGYDTGKAWALQADTYFRRLGMPADRPIYLSVDFDASSTHWPALDAAMDGAASVIGRERVGVYGSYRVVEHFAANRKARWYWQTYAWSGGKWSGWAHIQQYRNGATIGGADVDLNRAMVSDYGQWNGDDMAWTDKLPPGSTDNDDRTYADVMADLEDIRNWLVALETAKLGPGAPPPNSREGLLHSRMKAAAAGVETLLTRPGATVDVGTLAQAVADALRPDLEAAAEAAVRRVLGSVDGATPQG